MAVQVISPLVEVAKQAFRKPTTIEFPEQQERRTDNYNGKHKLDMKTCISCGACARICPNQTITMVDTDTERGTKKMPEINWERCLFCALCEEVCPTDCLILTKQTDYEVYDRRDLIKRPEELE
ncbi:MAG: 4Fe-4S binding protein [Candidatus Marsarchaeota archaeon]|jgi:formate hydrogenlyase subunit 6/NADH:ubiquinone oxidoreductase subunit I|nr:4Fe-4S binding protein [Candidatus Marsarchaeota archaeon]MCL5112420.1 4Fe-4S binding protein [Candidatus Marsarchaeota archaeon]